jgi:hypothetical protein
MKLIAGAAALAIATALSGAGQAATTIDFNEFKHDGVAKLYGGAVNSGGFSFIPDELNTGLAFWGSLAGSNNADPGGAALLNWNAKTVTVKRTDGLLFSLKSLQLADTYNAGAATPVRFTFFDGIRTTTQDLTLDRLKGLESFAFEEARLQWFSYTYTGSQGLQLDNIMVDSAVQAAVPEPATWAMMILGFGAAGSVLRRGRMVSQTA